MTHDDDERREARAAELLGERVDDLIAGRPAPAVLPAEERALLEMAGQIHASARTTPLGEARRTAIVEGALAGRVPGRAPPARARPRRAALVWGSLGLTALAAAAAIALYLGPRRPEATLRPAVLAPELCSRPTDALVGRIARAQAGAARTRIDIIYADRVAGYRQLKLGTVERKERKLP